MTTQQPSQYLCPECSDPGKPVGVTAGKEITVQLLAGRLFSPHSATA